MSHVQERRRSSGRWSSSIARRHRELYSTSEEPLTAAEERLLFQRLHDGNAAVRDRITHAGTPLVLCLARQYHSVHLELDDLVQEGMIGLIMAIDRFDPAKGTRFSTYAAYWIRQRLLCAMHQSSRLIRLPVDVLYAVRKAQSMRRGQVSESEDGSGIVDVARECGISARRLQAALQCAEEPLSLDARSEDEEEPLVPHVPDSSTSDPETLLIEADEREMLAELLNTLPRRDRLVLEARFGLCGDVVPLEDLAVRLRVSRDGVRQVQRRALYKLRRCLEERGFAWQLAC